MTRQTLTVTPRNQTGKGFNHRLRVAGTVPAVVYTKGKPAVPVSADPRAVAAILNGAFGKNAAIELSVDGEGTSRLAVIKDYTVHPVKRTLEHVDFWEINEDTVLTVSVPFAGEGKSESEKQGGKVRYTRDYIDVKAKPAFIPTKVVFDMTSLPAGNHNITVSKIPLPEGVTASFKHDYSLIQVSVPKVVATVEDPKKAKKDAKKGGKK